MLLGFYNYLVFYCGMSVVIIKNDDDDDNINSTFGPLWLVGPAAVAVAA